MALRSDLRVLVVDDMSVSRQILVQMLERLGVTRVDAVNTATEAAQKLTRKPVDLVISDLNMPAMDGVDLLRFIRGSDRLRRAHFVLTSGDDHSPRLDTAQGLGLDALLIKPFQIKALLACVEDAVGRI